MKAAKGGCSVKKCSEVWFWQGIREMIWIVHSRGTLTKLGALRSSHQRDSVRKRVLRNFANFTGKRTGVSFLIKLQASGPQTCSFINIETLAQVLSGEFCEISKNTFFTEHIWVTVSMLFKNLPFCVGY